MLVWLYDYGCYVSMEYAMPMTVLNVLFCLLSVFPFLTMSSHTGAARPSNTRKRVPCTCTSFGCKNQLFENESGERLSGKLVAPTTRREHRARDRTAAQPPSVSTTNPPLPASNQQPEPLIQNSQTVPVPHETRIGQAINDIQLHKPSTCIS
jgi:hypothetical protein